MFGISLCYRREDLSSSNASDQQRLVKLSHAERKRRDERKGDIFLAWAVAQPALTGLVDNEDVFGWWLHGSHRFSVCCSQYPHDGEIIKSGIDSKEGFVGLMPRTNQLSSQNVVAGVFPPCSQVQFPLFINMIYIFTCKKRKSKLKICQLLRVWLIRGLLQHSSFVGRSVAVEVRGRCLGGLHPATHSRNASWERQLNPKPPQDVCCLLTLKKLLNVVSHVCRRSHRTWDRCLNHTSSANVFFNTKTNTPPPPHADLLFSLWRIKTH